MINVPTTWKWPTTVFLKDDSFKVILKKKTLTLVTEHWLLIYSAKEDRVLDTLLEEVHQPTCSHSQVMEHPAAGLPPVLQPWRQSWAGGQSRVHESCPHQDGDTYLRHWGLWIRYPKQVANMMQQCCLALVSQGCIPWGRSKVCQLVIICHRPQNNQVSKTNLALQKEPNIDSFGCLTLFLLYLLIFCALRFARVYTCAPHVCLVSTEYKRRHF